MCGIAGFSASSPTVLSGQALNTPRQNLRRRGPDGDGEWVSDDARTGLCHTRLAILDLTSGGAQPMFSDDAHLVLTFNGEIYNWRDLRAELTAAGTRFKSQSDSEVLLAAWSAWGPKMLERLRGMFAFAIYDQRSRELFCARDRVGKKPFCYATGPAGFAFASDIPSLLPLARAIGADLGHDHGALATMLLHNLRHIPDPATAYRGLRRLRPGHAMIVRDGKILRTWRYWDVEAEVSRARGRAEKGAAGVREVLKEAVEIRRIADVPVGALLSGGTDSSAITALAQRRASEPLRTYALGLDANDEDLLRARAMAQRLGTIHREFFFDAAEQWAALRQIFAVYGEPIMLLPLVHTYELCRQVRGDGVKVALAGHGADELFYGYLGHIRTSQLSRLVRASEGFAGLAAHVPAALGWRTATVLAAARGDRKAALYRQYASALWRHLRPPADAARETVSDEMALWGRAGPNADYIDESNFVALLVENAHSVTIAADLPAMMSGVELRAPFLDQEMIALAMALSWRDKLPADGDPTRLKRILKQAVADLVPADLLYAPKRGFGHEIRERDVLLGPWRGMVQAAVDAMPADHWLDPAFVRGLWQRAQQGRPTDWSLLARIFALLTWEQTPT